MSAWSCLVHAVVVAMQPVRGFLDLNGRLIFDVSLATGRRHHFPGAKTALHVQRPHVAAAAASRLERKADLRLMRDVSTETSVWTENEGMSGQYVLAGLAAS